MLPGAWNLLRPPCVVCVVLTLLQGSLKWPKQLNLNTGMKWDTCDNVVGGLSSRKIHHPLPLCCRAFALFCRDYLEDEAKVCGSSELLFVVCGGVDADFVKADEAGEVGGWLKGGGEQSENKWKTFNVEIDSLVQDKFGPTSAGQLSPLFSVPNLRLPFGYIVQAGGPEHEVTRSPSLSAILLQVQHALNVRNNQSRTFKVLLQHQETVITCKTKTTEVIYVISCIMSGLFNATLRQ